MLHESRAMGADSTASELAPVPWARANPCPEVLAEEMGFWESPRAKIEEISALESGEEGQISEVSPTGRKGGGEGEDVKGGDLRSDAVVIEADSKEGTELGSELDSDMDSELDDMDS